MTVDFRKLRVESEVPVFVGDESISVVQVGEELSTDLLGEKVEYP